jgi:phthiocerol/phenolphthiocerol synthesis type-I polyketide synthase A
MQPKVLGAQVLDEVFPPGTLDFLFLTASAGAVFGIPGQGAYAEANAYLDCLARVRHQQGCYSVSLDWAAWQGTGFASEARVVTQELRRLGSRPVTPEEAFAAWEYVSRCDVAQAVIVPMPTVAQGAAVISDADRHSAPTVGWSQMSADDLHAELQSGLRGILATELRLPEAELDVDRPFAELGLDSVMAMSIRRGVEQLVGMELSVTMLWNHPTVSSLAGYLAEIIVPQDISERHVEMTLAPEGNVLDALFDSVESAPAGSSGAVW